MDKKTDLSQQYHGCEQERSWPRGESTESAARQDTYRHDQTEKVRFAGSPFSDAYDGRQASQDVQPIPSTGPPTKGQQHDKQHARMDDTEVGPVGDGLPPAPGIEISLNRIEPEAAVTESLRYPEHKQPRHACDDRDWNRD